MYVCSVWVRVSMCVGRQAARSLQTAHKASTRAQLVLSSSPVTRLSQQRTVHFSLGNVTLASPTTEVTGAANRDVITGADMLESGKAMQCCYRQVERLLQNSTAITSHRLTNQPAALFIQLPSAPLSSLPTVRSMRAHTRTACNQPTTLRSLAEYSTPATKRNLSAHSLESMPLHPSIHSTDCVTTVPSIASLPLALSLTHLTVGCSRATVSLTSECHRLTS